MDLGVESPGRTGRSLWIAPRRSTWCARPKSSLLEGNHNECSMNRLNRLHTLTPPEPATYPGLFFERCGWKGCWKFLGFRYIQEKVNPVLEAESVKRSWQTWLYLLTGRSLTWAIRSGRLLSQLSCWRDRMIPPFLCSGTLIFGHCDFSKVRKLGWDHDRSWVDSWCRWSFG